MKDSLKAKNARSIELWNKKDLTPEELQEKTDLEKELMQIVQYYGNFIRKEDERKVGTNSRA